MAPGDDPYGEPPAKPVGSRTATILSALGVAFLLFVVVQVASIANRNAAEFEAEFTVGGGDAVTVHYTVRLQGSRQVLATTDPVVAQEAARSGPFVLEPAAAYQPLSFAVGSGESGLGTAFEEAVLGHFEGETVAWGPVRGSVAFGPWEPVGQTFPRAYGPFPLEQELDPRFVRQYEAQLGPLAVGAAIRVFRDFPWSQEVVAKDGDAVTVRHVVADGDSYPWQVPPSTLVLDVDEAADEFAVRFDATMGEAFAIRPGSPGAAFFEPGAYRISEVGRDSIRLQFSRAPDPRAVDGMVVVEIRILKVE